MNSQPAIITFGEIMLRLTPTRNHARLVQADSLKLDYAGAESNVAIALAQWHNRVNYLTKLPANALGDGAINLLQGFGVGTDLIQRAGDRIGIYFIEGGASIRPSSVTYDRRGSAVAETATGDFDWSSILTGHSWLHLTGITPALSPVYAIETINAAQTAKDLGVKVSFDLNYRRKLWDKASDAARVFDSILENTDLLIANEGALADVYGRTAAGDDAVERATVLMTQMRKDHAIDKLAFTIRDHSSASRNQWQGLWYDDSGFHQSQRHDLQIVDRFGGGDAFAAGILHGLQQNWPSDRIVEYATAASALQQTIPGDLCVVSEQEINKVLAGHISGHVER